MSLTYQEEVYEHIMEEIEDLGRELTKEVDRYEEEPIVAIDHDQFIHMDVCGVLQCITVRDDNKIVGFHISSIQNDIFFKYTKMAYVLFYYLLPEYRGKGRGTHMFKYAEAGFRAKGAKRAFMSRKIYIPNEKLFADLNYTQIEANYTKLL